MVVNRVGEMVSGYSVRLQNYDVLIVFGYRYIPLYRVAEGDFILYTALRFKTDYERFARFQVSVNLLLGKVAASGIFAVIARSLFLRGLLFADGVQLVLGAEARR